MEAGTSSLLSTSAYFLQCLPCDSSTVVVNFLDMKASNVAPSITNRPHLKFGEYSVPKTADDIDKDHTRTRYRRWSETSDMIQGMVKDCGHALGDSPRLEIHDTARNQCYNRQWVNPD